MNLICCLAFLVPFQFLTCKQASESPQASHLPGNQQKQKTDKAKAVNIAFKSADGGTTWQDISEMLPEGMKKENGAGRNGFFADYNRLYFTAGNGTNGSTANATAPSWIREIFPGEQSSVAPGKAGKFAYHYWGVNLKKTNGTSVWSPIFENFQEPRIRTVFETAGGAIFIGTDRGLFKTDNSGKTWKHVYAGGLAGNLAESNGVLLGTSMRRVIRSTDIGETWAVVTSEGSLAFDVKPIKGGFAAITASSELGTRKLRSSYDAGKTWRPIDAGPQGQVLTDSIWRTWNDRPRLKAFQTSIIQVGENYFCTHPEGIFGSSDKGKTWKLLLPASKRQGLQFICFRQRDLCDSHR
jgi:hypothetical protein